MCALKLEDIHYTYDDYKLWKGDWEIKFKSVNHVKS